MAMIEVLVRRQGQPYARLQLTKPRLIVGRDPSADVILDSGHVSRRHAEITVEKGAIVLADQGSRNGIVVDGARHQQIRLAPGEVARIAEFELTYRFLEDARSLPKKQTRQPSELSAGWEEY